MINQFVPFDTTCNAVYWDKLCVLAPSIVCPFVVANVTVPEPVFLIVKNIPYAPVAVGRVIVFDPDVFSTKECEVPTLPMVFITRVKFVVVAVYSMLISEVLTFAPE